MVPTPKRLLEVYEIRWERKDSFLDMGDEQRRGSIPIFKSILLVRRVQKNLTGWKKGEENRNRASGTFNEDIEVLTD